MILARGHGSGSVDRQCSNSEVSSGDLLKCQVLTSVFSPSLHGAMPGVNHSKTNMKMDEHVPTMAGLFDMLNPGRK